MLLVDGNYHIHRKIQPMVMTVLPTVGDFWVAIWDTLCIESTTENFKECMHASMYVRGNVNLQEVGLTKKLYWASLTPTHIVEAFSCSSWAVAMIIQITTSIGRSTQWSCITVQPTVNDLCTVVCPFLVFAVGSIAKNINECYHVCMHVRGMWSGTMQSCLRPLEGRWLPILQKLPEGPQ